MVQFYIGINTLVWCVVCGMCFQATFQVHNQWEIDWTSKEVIATIVTGVMALLSVVTMAIV